MVSIYALSIIHVLTIFEQNLSLGEHILMKTKSNLQTI